MAAKREQERERRKMEEALRKEAIALAKKELE